MKCLAVVSICLFITSSAFARGGPKYGYTDPHLDDEINNLYENMSDDLYNGGRITSGTVVNLTFSTATIGNILGTTSGSNPCVSCVGYYLESVVSGISLGTTNQWKDISTITLPPGNWIVTGQMYVTTNGATVTFLTTGISVTSGNSSTGISSGDNQAGLFLPTAAIDSSGVIGGYHKSVSVSTPIYLKVLGAYTVATPQAFARLSAIRTE